MGPCSFGRQVKPDFAFALILYLLLSYDCSWVLSLKTMAWLPTVESAVPSSQAQFQLMINILMITSLYCVF